MHRCATPDCSDLPKDTVHFKVTVKYEDAFKKTTNLDRMYDNSMMNADNPGNPLVNSNAIEMGMHFSIATGGHVDDYIVPQCPAGTAPAECVNTLTWEEPIHVELFSKTIINKTLGFNLIQAYPHVHAGVLSTKIDDVLTNTTICEASVANGKIVLGTGTAQSNEKGYLVGQLPCEWSASGGPDVYAGQMIRITTVYDASVKQLGVMSAWFFHVAQIPEIVGQPWGECLAGTLCGAECCTEAVAGQAVSCCGSGAALGCCA